MRQLHSVSVSAPEHPFSLWGNHSLFANKTVWVTGAAQGIGLQIANTLLALGARVIGIDRQVAAIDLPAHDFELVQLNLADAQAVAECCETLLAAGKAPQVLINAAGVLRLGALESLSLDDWHSCFDVNVSGVFYLLRNLIPHFKQQGFGSIVNIASNAAHVPRINMGAYCASKAALVSLSHCVALELAAYGVRCNLVSPGSTDTAMLRNMLAPAGADSADIFERTIQGLPEQFKLGIPLKKIASAQEVANTAVFLASDLASHITMQDIVVDGGATLAA